MSMTEQERDILRAVEERIEELKNIKQLLLKCQKDYECAAMERDQLRQSNDRLLWLLKELAKENCDKCAKVKEYGSSIACCNCKWVEIAKNGK